MNPTEEFKGMAERAIEILNAGTAPTEDDQQELLAIGIGAVVYGILALGRAADAAERIADELEKSL